MSFSCGMSLELGCKPIELYRLYFLRGELSGDRAPLEESPAAWIVEERFEEGVCRSSRIIFSLLVKIFLLRSRGCES